jgi:hypothetical protein
MEVHQIKMFEIEFMQYLIGIKNEAKVEHGSNINPQDIVIITEIESKKGKETGKHVIFRVKEVERYHGLYEDFILDKIVMEKEKNLNYAQLIRNVSN